MTSSAKNWISAHARPLIGVADYVSTTSDQHVFLKIIPDMSICSLWAVDGATKGREIDFAASWQVV